jgi:hypothetical protein
MALKPKFTRRRTVLAVVETTRGTDPGTGYAALSLNVGATNNSTANLIERNELSAEFGIPGLVASSKIWEASYQAYIKGGGSVSPEPEISPFLQACASKYEAGVVLVVPSITGTFTNGEGVTQATSSATGVVLGTTSTQIFLYTVTGTFNATNVVTGDDSGATATPSSVVDSAVYTPVSAFADMKTAAIRDYPDSILKQMTYAVGNAVLNLAVEEIPTVDFTLTGIYSAPTTTSPAAATVSTVDPKPWINATVKVGTLPAGCSAAMQSLSLDLGNTVSQIKCAEAADGITALLVTEAMPTASLVMTRTDLSDFNPWTLRDASTTFEIATQYGTGAGERIRIGIPSAQISAVTESDTDSLEAYNIDVAATKDGVNPKWHLIFF